MSQAHEAQHQCARLLALMAQAVALETARADCSHGAGQPRSRPLRPVLEQALMRLEPMLGDRRSDETLQHWVHALADLERELKAVLAGHVKVISRDEAR